METIISIYYMLSYDVVFRFGIVLFPLSILNRKIHLIPFWYDIRSDAVDLAECMKKFC